MRWWISSGVQLSNWHKNEKTCLWDIKFILQVFLSDCKEIAVENNQIRIARSFIIIMKRTRYAHHSRVHSGFVFHQDSGFQLSFRALPPEGALPPPESSQGA